jgi:glutathione S-transferase
MKLYCSKTSPYSRKVRVVVEELKLTERVEEVLVDPFNPPAELLAANPLSKIPTLTTDHGEALPDSSLIIEYLQTLGNALPALPRGTQRWAALRRLQLAEGIIDAAVATVFEKRRPEGIIYTAFLDRQAERIRRSLEALDLEAMTLSQQDAGLVEITTGVALAYLDFRMPYLEWRKFAPALASWHDVFALRPSMQNTQPPA